MENSLKQRIANEAQEFIKFHNMSNAEFAKRAGVRNEYLTHIFRENSDFTIPTGSEKKTIIADKYFEKIAAFIGLSLQKTYWEVQPTQQLINSLSILQDSKDYGSTNLIIGETGSGKTQSIELFTRKNPADTFVVTVGSTDNLADLIDKIIEQLKITTGKTKSKKLRDIAAKLRQLKDDGQRPQLILDESEYMKQPALCSIKELYDHLHQHASIVLIGTEQLLNNIDQLRKKNKPGIPQFYRRIKFGIRRLPSVDRTFALFIDGLSKDVTKFLREICDNYGELHDVLVPVRREAERTGEPITVDFIKKVLNLN